MDALDIGTKFHFHDGAMTVQRTQDCTPIVEHTKALQRAGHTGSSEMKHAAKLPFVIVETYCNVNGITFAEFMQNNVHIKRVLNDPNLADFRIWQGRV
jgi:hypothetical protein